MARMNFLLLSAVISIVGLTTLALAQGQVRIPQTRFTCTGRPSGYYADVDTGCQVYHMCDGLGRQFSYSCPNTTLFQQRMLICDHWYMVNCSMSESDYGANLLIGQRDKPFVSEADMLARTPRPDILSVPLNNNYYDGLKEAESKFPVHPGNSIVGIADSISSANNNGLDSAKQNYRPPSSWSTGTGVNNRPTAEALKHDFGNEKEEDSITDAASHKPGPTFLTPEQRPTPNNNNNNNINNKPLDNNKPLVTPPSKELIPPPAPSTTESPSGEIDIRLKDSQEDPVYNFIKRFDPNSPDSHKTAMTRSEIINLNEQLPDGQISAEEERTPRKNKDIGNNFNRVRNDKKTVEGSRFDTVNTKPINTDTVVMNNRFGDVPTPHRELVPPKKEYSEQPLTTMGPPVYYEWKWAAPAFDLEPPKEDNKTVTNNKVSQVGQEKRNIGRSPFSSVTRPTPIDVQEPIAPTKNSEYNISSYLVPDYVFPLDKPHPGYEDENAQTSFQVKVGRPGRSSYGENPNCPHCHPAYLEPGTCEPCIVKR